MEGSGVLHRPNLRKADLCVVPACRLASTFACVSRSLDSKQIFYPRSGSKRILEAAAAQRSCSEKIPFFCPAADMA
jgi:hypothetical protein